MIFCMCVFQPLFDYDAQHLCTFLVWCHVIHKQWNWLVYVKFAEFELETLSLKPVEPVHSWCMFSKVICMPPLCKTWYCVLLFVCEYRFWSWYMKTLAIVTVLIAGRQVYHILIFYWILVASWYMWMSVGRVSCLYVCHSRLMICCSCLV